MKNLTPELVEKAKAAKSVAELLELAKANNVEITEEEADAYFDQLGSNGIISDEELDAVAGGGNCPNDEFNVGELVQSIDGTGCQHCDCKTGAVAVTFTRPIYMYIKCTKCGQSMWPFWDTNNLKKI